MYRALAPPSGSGGGVDALWWGDATLRQIYGALSPEVSAQDLTRICDVIGEWVSQLRAIAEQHRVNWRNLALGHPDSALQAAYDRADAVRLRLLAVADDLEELLTTLNALNVQFCEMRAVVTDLYQANGLSAGDNRLMGWLLLADGEALDRAAVDATERSRGLMQQYETASAQALQHWQEVTTQHANVLDTPPMGIPAISVPAAMAPAFVLADADTVPVRPQFDANTAAETREPAGFGPVGKRQARDEDRPPRRRVASQPVSGQPPSLDLRNDRRSFTRREDPPEAQSPRPQRRRFTNDALFLPDERVAPPVIGEGPLEYP